MHLTSLSHDPQLLTLAITCAVTDGALPVQFDLDMSPETAWSSAVCLSSISLSAHLPGNKSVILT